MNYLRFADLKDHGVFWSRPHVDRLEKANKFPRRVKLGENTVAWIEEEIEAMQAAKRNARNGAT
jgi:prophage regulatory protein